MSSPITTSSTEVATRGKVTPTRTVGNAPPRQGPTRVVNNPTPPTTSGANPPRPPTTKVQMVPNSSTSGATDTIIVCSMVMIGSSLIKDVAHGQPSIKPVVTGMMLGGALLIIGTFAPTLAKLLAITGLVGALMTNGSTLINIGEKIK